MEIEELWDELEFELKSHKVIKLAQVKETKLYLGSGNKNAPILFVGNDPDLYENEELLVKAGSSGEFLIKLCDLADINPDSYYLTTLTKCNLKWNALSPQEQKIRKELLYFQISLLNPKVIVLLGAVPLEIIYQEDLKLSGIRGEKIEWTGGIKLLPTYDPTFVKSSRDQEGKKSRPAIEFWQDLKLLKGLI